MYEPSDVPGFTDRDMADSEKLAMPPYSRILRVKQGSDVKIWEGLDKNGNLIAHLTGKGASDIFRCRATWKDPPVL
jgi:hypothetical protein